MWAWEQFMTEAEWLACDEPWQMVRWIKRVISPRQFRLYVCGSCRASWDELTPAAIQSVVAVLERGADGLAGEEELQAAWTTAQNEVERLWSVMEETSGGWRNSLVPQLHALNGALASAFRTPPNPESWQAHRRYVRSKLECHLLRDIFGNPFRPTSIATAWLTTDAVGIARVAYEDRALPAGTLSPVRLLILADALEEAGCSDPAILDHLRGPGPHTRGCWVVDRVLARE
jgi:hypothetical protein